MLIIVHKGREEEVKRIFDKWDLPWAEIGIVTDTGHMVVQPRRQIVVDIPAKKIADESPVYQREAQEPAYLKDVRAFRLDGIADTKDAGGRFEKTARVAEHRLEELGLSPIRSHGARWFGGLPGSDAAVIRIKTDSLPVMSAELAAKVAARKCPKNSSP